MRIVTLLSLAGMIVTAYLVYQHYKPSGGSFCNVDEYINCDIVNKSKYAEIGGAPVSAIGFFGYAFFFVISLGFLKHWHFEKIWSKLTNRKMLGILALAAAAGLAFSFYLTYVEFFVLRAVCVLCVTQQILILFIFIFSLILWRGYLKSAHL